MKRQSAEAGRCVQPEIQAARVEAWRQVNETVPVSRHVLGTVRFGVQHEVTDWVSRVDIAAGHETVILLTDRGGEHG